MSLLASLSLPWPAAVVLASAVVVAMCIDHAFGELPARGHPVVWMGHYLGWAGRRVAPDLAADSAAAAPGDQADYRSFWLGALAWSAGAALVLIVAGGLQEYALQLPGVFAALLLGFLLKPMLAWRMLRTEVQAVELALAQSLAAGRERLSWLVSRDVTTLSESGVRESAIESLAENFNDSVVAPFSSCCWAGCEVPICQYDAMGYRAFTGATGRAVGLLATTCCRGFLHASRRCCCWPFAGCAGLEEACQPCMPCNWRPGARRRPTVAGRWPPWHCRCRCV